jgi:hypothetical protein
MEQVEFLFDNQLISEVEILIKKSEHELLLISPFIDLDLRIQDALQAKINSKDFKLKVLFGKNEHNIYKSIKKNSLEFLKQFPDVEIRYNKRLHAKFYQNDFDFIMTSLNLYDYSLAKNIEVGVKNNFASKGLVKRAYRDLGKLLDVFLSKVDRKVFGNDDDLNPREKFQAIFENSELKYKTEPVIERKEGIKGFFGATEVKGKNIQTDELSGASPKIKVEKRKPEKPKSTTQSIQNPQSTSVTKLAKSLGIKPTEITSIMEKSGYIENNIITSKGLTKGLIEKQYMGKTYIAYPDDMEEIIQLSNKTITN